MSKKNFIALADAIKDHNRTAQLGLKWGNGQTAREFSEDQLDIIANFCRAQNTRFDRERWMDYIAGQCGPHGGKR